MAREFWDSQIARKIRAVPMSKLAREARAEAKTKARAKRDEMRKPLDASRPLPDGLFWFALNVKGQTEFQVAQWLERRTWFTVTPTKEESRLLSGKRGGKVEKRRVIVKAELSGFVLAGIYPYPAWLDLKTNGNIYGPLATLGTPLLLSRGDVARFQTNAALSAAEAAERALMADNLTRIREAIRKDGMATAIIKDGPFAGRAVSVHSVSGTKAKVSMNMFGGKTLTELSTEQLDAA